MRRKNSDKREGAEIGPLAQAIPQHGVTSSLDLTANNTDGVAVLSPLDVTANNDASYHPLDCQDWSFMDWPTMMNYPDPLPTDDLAKPSMPGSVSSYQPSNEPEGLARISEQLEETLLHATTTWRVQDIQTYPIGEVFDIFESLSEALHSFGPTLRSPGGETTSSVLGDTLRLRPTFLAATCYVLCVKIMTSVAEVLQKNLTTAMKSDWVSPLDTGNDGFPSRSGTSHSSIVLGNILPRLDTLRHSLAVACLTLRKGIGQLRDIEEALNIPHAQGVSTDAVTLLTERTPGKRRESTVLDTGAVPPCIYISSGCVSRLVAVLWQEEELAPDTGASTNTLAKLRGFQNEIMGLAKEYKVLDV